MKSEPIRVGDRFQSNDEVWTVTEDLRFGRGYWVVSESRRRQTIFNRATLESMQRVSGATKGR